MTNLAALRKVLFVSSTIAVSAYAGTSNAAIAVLEEITVTAQKRAQGLQDVPISIQVINGTFLAEANISRLQDLSDNIPNVIIGKSSTNARVYVRGIGTDSNAGFEQSVAIFSDGLYMGRGQQSKFPFIDLERVEVLKGPQGTLFGKNTTAGAINITSKNPGDEFEGEARVGAGEYGEYTGHLVVSGPLTDTLGARLALFGREYDGYLDNTLLGQDEESREEFGARTTLAWDANEKLAFNLKWETGEFSTEGTNYQVTYDPSAEAALTPLLGEGRLDQKKSEGNIGLLGASPAANETTLNNLILRADYDANYGVWSFISGYSGYDFENNIDADFSPLSIAFQGREEELAQVSQEIRLTSTQDGPIDYIVGLYYQDANLDVDTYSSVDATLLGAPITAGSLSQFRQDSKTLAAFGQLNWRFAEQWTATLGLRWSDEEKNVTEVMTTGLWDLSPNPVGDFVIGRLGGAAHNLKEDRSESDLSPMLRMQWDTTDDLMFYVSISQGYKGGGFDASDLNGSMGTTADDSFEYDEEEVTAFELGGKMVLQSGAANLNWALYRSDYENLQVSTFNGTGFVISNAGETRVQGLEVDYRWAVSDRLRVNVNTAYLDFEWQDFANAPCTIRQEVSWEGAGDCTQDLGGERGALTPEFTASAGVEYTYPLTNTMELRSTLNMNYSDEFYTESDLDPNVLQESYTKFNLWFTLASVDDAWEISLIGKNLTDEIISTAGNDNPLIDFAYRRYVEPPRQWSVQALMRF